MKLSAHVDDVADAGRGEVADMLRPFYLEYLRKHGVTAPRLTPFPTLYRRLARR